MVRYLSEKDVEQLLTMPIALELVEKSFRDRARGKAVDVPRVRTRIPGSTLHIMQAGAPEMKLVGYKAYFHAADKGTSYYLHLYSTDTGKLEAIIQSSRIGWIRTGAASGVATRLLARKDAAVLGMIGAGKQLAGQLEAMCSVRPVREARVWNRTAETARQFCETMSGRFKGVALKHVATQAEAVRGADIVTVMTKSPTPMLRGEWLEPGQHVNAIGSNSLARQEIDMAAVRRSAVLVVDSRGAARTEGGDLMPLVEDGHLEWDNLVELGEVLEGRAPGRTADDQITLYESHGMAMQDLYVGARLLQLARERNVGADLPIGG
jgi:ornithine cyclodeaminase/alanine dehydrogenase-like protein (mu-crystallin family)